MNVDGRREGLFKPPGLIEKLQAMKGRVKGTTEDELVGCHH